MHIEVSNVLTPAIAIVYEIPLTPRSTVRLIVIHRLFLHRTSFDYTLETIEICIRINAFSRCVPL